MDLSTSRKVRGFIKALVLLICLAYLMLYIMMPTMTYSHKWRASIDAKLSSTYFGDQGPTLLVYTLPVLFVAVAGSIYLHLEKQQMLDGSFQRSRGMKGKIEGGIEIARRPMVVKGPLGIVSGIELGFLTIFIALLVWSYAIYLHNGFSSLSASDLAKKGKKMWEAKLGNAAHRLGLVGNICLCLLFFPVTRSSSILPIFGLTSEISIKYHIWLGHITMIVFTAHGLCFIVLWAAAGHINRMVRWKKNGVSNVAGELSLLAGLVLWVMTYPRVRRRAFEVFFYTHHLYILFVFFYVLHVGISSAGYMLPGFYLFMIDRYLRFLQSRRHVRLISSRVLSSQALELNFSKCPGLSYAPTSIMFINVPSISKLQWHPFSITSSSSLEPGKLSILIKVEGSWTRKLLDTVTSSTVDHLQVSVEGPYGPASTSFLRHDTLVMVSGGSGITPFFSIIRELIHKGATLKTKIPKLLLISSFKNPSDLAMLDLLLPMSYTFSDLSSIQLQIEAYVTREKEHMRLRDIKNGSQTVWFKPNAKDASISPILGKNMWLWLGLIISSSFLGFLIITGIIARYYIYPIDHNTNKVFPTSTKAILSILIICFCIAASATGAVLWNKRQTTMEGGHVVSMEGMNPTMTPDSWFYNTDRELEGFPQQSILQRIDVQYGQRPDIKRMLLGYKGDSVGVLVSGPKKLRHEVAAICASSEADNLYFESISFSW